VALRAPELDRQLADGAPPSASPLLQLRALQLATARRRWSLAGSFRAIVRDVRGPARWSSEVAVRRGAVREAEGHVLELADALTDPACSSLRGVAQASCLLTDARSPLYVPAELSLAGAVERVLATLRG
jgi:hypothetical protein